MRNNIQKMKIDMANEVIDAGRFDMKTTMGERRQTLEDMLQVCWGCTMNATDSVEQEASVYLLPALLQPELGYWDELLP